MESRTNHVNIEDTGILYPLETDRLDEIRSLSVRVYNALHRAGITTVNELRNTTDYQLSHIRNLGVKSIAVINAAIPDRIRTYDGEAEEIEARCVKRKIEIDAGRILRYMEHKSMKLSEAMPTRYRYTRAKKALTDYCAAFPERVYDVLTVFETVGDTGDKFYKTLKQAVSGGIND